VRSHRRIRRQSSRIHVHTADADATPQNSFVTSASAVCIGLYSILHSHLIHHSTVGVVGLWTPPKIQTVGVRHPQKVRGGGLSIQKRDVGICHFQTAVKCTKRCVPSHKIAHETPQNRLRLRLRPGPRRGSSRLEGGTSLPIPLPVTPLTAVVGRS